MSSSKFAEQSLDLDHRFNLLAQIGLEQPAIVIVVKPVHGAGEFPAHLHVETVLQLAQDGLRLHHLPCSEVRKADAGDAPGLLERPDQPRLAVGYTEKARQHLLGGDGIAVTRGSIIRPAHCST